MVRSKINLYKLFTIILLIANTLLPKINLISVPGTTTGIRIEDFFLFIWIVLYLTNRTDNKRIDSIEFKKIRKMFNFYLIVCFISTSLGFLRGEIGLINGLLFLFRKLEYFFYMYVGYYIYNGSDSNNKLLKFFKGTIIIHFFVIILQNIGVIGSFQMGQLQDQLVEGSRLCSTFNGPYEFAAYLLFLLPFLLKEVKNNRFNIIYILIIFVSIFLSQSRTSLVLIVLMLIIYWALNSGLTKKKIAQLFVVCGLIFVLIINLNNLISVLPRFDTINIDKMIYATKVAWNNRDYYSFSHGGGYSLVKGVPVDLSYNIRISRDVNLIDGFLKYPLFGCGLSIVKISADCNYIRTLAECGLIGFIAFYKMILYIYGYSKINKDELSYILRYGIISLLLGSIFIDLFEASKIMTILWFIVGFKLKKDYLNRREQYE